MKNYEIISLGNFCLPRVLLTKAGLKPSKINGELSMPFDLAYHDAHFITGLIKNRFEHYFDNLYYDHSDKFWRNGKNLVGSGARYDHDEFDETEVAQLIERYKRRIATFYSIVKTHLPVLFVQALDENKQHIDNLFSVLKKIRAHKSFELVIIDIAGILDKIDNNINMLKIPYPDPGYKWSQPEWYLSEKGRVFEKTITDFCAKIITEKLDCEVVQWQNQNLRLY